MAGTVNIKLFTLGERDCRLDEMRCPDGRCIDASWVCDGEFDCKDGEDELNCTKKEDVEQRVCKRDEFR